MKERARKKQNDVDGQKNGHEIMRQRKPPRQQEKRMLIIVVKEIYSM
jgi:hypothetical protein